MAVRITDAIRVRPCSKVIGHASIVRYGDPPRTPAINHAEGRASLINDDPGELPAIQQNSRRPRVPNASGARACFMGGQSIRWIVIERMKPIIQEVANGQIVDEVEIYTMALVEIGTRFVTCKVVGVDKVRVRSVRRIIDRVAIGVG